MAIELPARVWLARRKPDVPPEQFITQLRARFVPITVRWMTPLGLTAYYPTLLDPATADGPHEIALVFYESEERYLAARANAVGKAYAAAHGEIFDRAIHSGWPTPWNPAETPTLNTAVHSSPDKPADWRYGPIAVFSLAWASDFDPGNWVSTLCLPHISSLGQVGQWVAFGAAGYIVVWALLEDGPQTTDALQAALTAVPPTHSSLKLAFASLSRDEHVTAGPPDQPPSPVVLQVGETLHVLLDAPDPAPEEPPDQQT